MLSLSAAPLKQLQNFLAGYSRPSHFGMASAPGAKGRNLIRHFQLTRPIAALVLGMGMKLAPPGLKALTSGFPAVLAWTEHPAQKKF
ncbi:MAG: hypothetical protein ACI9I0_000701 [Rhodoferax sp.]